MNPYRQIERLEKKVRNLEDENKQLRNTIKENQYTVASAEAKLRETAKLEQEYFKLIHELEECQNEYNEVMRGIRATQKNIDKAYKKLV